MKTFIFLRHGEYKQPIETPSAHLPYPLTETGIQQSQLAIQKITQILEKHNLSLHPTIHSSSLLRSYQTSKIIFNTMNAINGYKLNGITSSDELAERSLGNLANLTVLEIESILQLDPRIDAFPLDWKSNSEFKLPGIGTESLIEAGLRVKNYIQSVIEKVPENQAVLFVGHGASFRHAALHMGALSLSEIKQYSMHYAEPLTFKSHLSKWQLIEGSWKKRMNESYND